MRPGLFERYAAYYDLLYRDKDYAAEVDYVLHTLHEAAPHIKAVLELGCGTGRHARLLASRGLGVVGVERSKSMAAAACAADLSTVSGNFKCTPGDIENGRFDRLRTELPLSGSSSKLDGNDQSTRKTQSHARRAEASNRITLGFSSERQQVDWLERIAYVDIESLDVSGTGELPYLGQGYFLADADFSLEFSDAQTE